MLELKNVLQEIIEDKCASYCCDNTEEVGVISDIISAELQKEFEIKVSEARLKTVCWEVDAAGHYVSRLRCANGAIYNLFVAQTYFEVESASTKFKADCLGTEDGCKKATKFANLFSTYL